MKKQKTPAGAVYGGAVAAAPKAIKISRKSIIIAVSMALALVIAAYVLTFVLKRGAYDRDASGTLIDGTYHELGGSRGVPFWKLLLAPFMILNPASGGSEVMYAIIVLMLVIGAVFTVLDESGVIVYMVNSIAYRFKNKKYLLIFALSFAFMFLGSAVGMFEELIPLVPVVILLSYAFGWDALVGLSISVLAAGCGFAAGVVNPFSVGIPQTIGGLELFSGIGMRLLTFVLTYAVVALFTYFYAKKIDKAPQKSSVYKEDLIRKAEFSFSLDSFERDAKKSAALRFFGLLIGFVVLCSIVAVFWHTLANYIMYITVVIYIIGGIGAAIICGIRGKRLFKLLGRGALTLAPSVVMILVVGSVRYIIEEGGIMDTILYKSINAMSGKTPFSAALILYGIVILFNAFIPSGSAKAYLIMPVVFQVCAVVGIHPQTAVLVYAFGDGFSNMILPSNAGLLLILGLSTVNYPKWFRHGGKILLAVLVLTVGVIWLAQNVVYS